MRWIPEYRPCPICSSDEFRKIGTRGGRSHRDGLGVETTVVECRSCSVRYTHPVLLPIGNPYDDEAEYFHRHDPDWVKGAGAGLADTSERLLGRKGRMLEIGCGRGILLEGAQERGWTVFGIEMTEQFAQEAVNRGVKVDVATAETSRFLDETYDVILCPAILEHLYDPMNVLKRASDALVPGGLLFIDVPNEASLVMLVGNLYYKPWSINLAPTFSPYHVIGFTPGSVKKALDLVGLRIKEMKIVKYQNFLPGGSLKRNLERLGMGLVQRIGGIIGRGDGLEVWAQKVI